MEPNSNPAKDVPDNGSGRTPVTERAREAFDGVSHKVGDLASRTKESLAGAATRVQDTAGRASRSTRQMIADHPISAMAIGVGAGIVIGLLLARRLFR